MLLLAATTGFALNARAQATTEYGDNVSTLNGIVKAYYAVVTVRKGQKPSYKRDSSLHIPGALVGGTNLGKDGKMHTMTLKQYHLQEDAELAKTGFYEQEIARKVAQYNAPVVQLHRIMDVR